MHRKKVVFLFPFVLALVLLTGWLQLARLNAAAPYGVVSYTNNLQVTDETYRVSIASDGTQGNGTSAFGYISDNGQWVIFSSFADTLVISDTNNAEDVFLHDRMNGETSRISVGSNNAQANGPSGVSSTTPDGRYIVLVSWASNLVVGDTNNTGDVFVYDRLTMQTSLVSINSVGQQSNGNSYKGTISHDGRFVAFVSVGTNLVTNDNNNQHDIFVHDRQTQSTVRVSVNSAGDEANSYSEEPFISGNGQLVAFTSHASNLVQGDTNNQIDVFVHSLVEGTTVRASVSSSGVEANKESLGPSLSADGQRLAFHSRASNLVANDTNSSSDVFLRDLNSGSTTRISESQEGNNSNGHSDSSQISGDGSTIIFSSEASNLIPDDMNSNEDVFVHHIENHQISLISLSTAGKQGNGQSFAHSLASNATYAVFSSSATNLVEGDTNGKHDVFVRGPVPFIFTESLYLPLMFQP